MSKTPDDGKGFDWSRVQDQPGDTAPQPGQSTAMPTTPTRVTSPATRPPAGPRRDLMSFCQPLFGLAALLPREPGQSQPAYPQFRERVVAGLDAIENEAPRFGIEREDAQQATFALSLFLDEQVADSEWQSRSLWATEPLHLVRLGDPEGGINFFKRLEGLGDRQREVKDVFLTCLALGYRGRFAELEATQQAAQIGLIRQKLVREVLPQPVESRTQLFPEGYQQGTPVAGPSAGAPRWWLIAGWGAAALFLVIWLLLTFSAGSSARSAEDALRGALSAAPAERSTR